MNLAVEIQMARRFKSYGRSVLSILVLSGMFGRPFLMNLRVGHAQTGTSDVGRFDNFMSGGVTEVRERERILRIDDKEYRILDDASITDARKNVMDWKDISPSTQILFHLKQGRIDQIIILLPS